jgi:hypothetical protein
MEFHETLSLRFCHIRSGTPNKADIRFHSCLSNAHDKNWINGLEARISIENNKPIKYYCIDFYCYCVIFIFTHCMSSVLRGLLPFYPLHYTITILPITLYYYHFAYYIIFIALMDRVDKNCSVSPKFVACNRTRSQNLTFISFK